MPYATLADAVVCFHFLWIVFLLIGGVWGRRHRFLGRIHIAAVVFAFFIEILDWYCPLTHLEVWLREKAAQGGYREAFISHYLNKLIYIDVPHWIIVILTLLFCLWNAWLYLGAGKSRS